MDDMGDYDQSMNDASLLDSIDGYKSVFNREYALGELGYGSMMSLSMMVNLTAVLSSYFVAQKSSDSPRKCQDRGIIDLNLITFISCRHVHYFPNKISLVYLKVEYWKYIFHYLPRMHNFLSHLY